MTRLVEIQEAVVGGDGVLRLSMKAEDGARVDLKMGTQAQAFILKALLGSTLDPLSPTSQQFEPIGLSRFRVDEDIGLSFLFSSELGIHFKLDRSLASILKELIVTFDDPMTWHTPKLN